MHPQFETIRKECRILTSRGATLWAAMVTFAVDTSSDWKGTKESFKEQEKLVREANQKDNLQKVGAYRSAKSIILSAIDLGVSLTDAHGKPRGKTDVEKEIKDSKGETSALVKFQRHVTQAGKLELQDGDVTAAYTVLKTLFDKMDERCRSVLKAAA